MITTLVVALLFMSFCLNVLFLILLDTLKQDLCAEQAIVDDLEFVIEDREEEISTLKSEIDWLMNKDD